MDHYVYETKQLSQNPSNILIYFQKLMELQTYSYGWNIKKILTLN